MSGARAGPARAGAGSSRGSVVVPFFAYAAFFMAVPVVVLVIKTFQAPSGAFTLSQVRDLFSGQYRAGLHGQHPGQRR